jgi:adenosylcobyric acid synthase
MTTRPAATLMVQGTTSSAGKSILVTALCRLFSREGVRVAPFKAQNMSLNSYVTPDGLEIGRAQAVQAEAAGVELVADMNPILLKPEADHRSQIIVMGKVRDDSPPLGSPDYVRCLWPAVEDSLARLRDEYELVVIEGAGSPAEINLRDRDLVNMRVASAVQAPVLIIGDIERGGLLAHFVGTLALLEPEERDLVKGLVVNRFRGDIGLLEPGLVQLEELANKPVLGVIPYIKELRIAAEDSLQLEQKNRATEEGLLDIAIIALPYVSKFDEFDALESEPQVTLRYVRSVEEFGEPDLVILPGTKSTLADLATLRESGLAEKVLDHAKRDGAIVGVCGGYQMLGQRISDPHGVESTRGEVEGLGILPMETVLAPDKTTQQVTAEVNTASGLLGRVDGATLAGYEIHLGETRGTSTLAASFQVFRNNGEKIEDGCINDTGTVFGTYLHGLFDNASVRSSVIAFLAGRREQDVLASDSPLDREAEYDRLADVVERSLDMPAIQRLVGLGT